MPPDRYKGQTLTIYFPESSEYQEIRRSALAAKIAESHYAREMIRTGMQYHGIQPNTEFLEESAQSREALAMARRSLKDSEAARLKLETELFALKGSLFLQPVPEGRGSLSSELVDLLKDGHVWRSVEIMDALGIDPKNIDALKVLAGQLHALQDLKMIEETTRGWKWIL
jgi:hypothetical protein